MTRHVADPSSWLRLHRTVRFGDTDAAGVMHFHQLLRWCHEAYEESLERFGLEPTAVFPTPAGGPPEALPIVHCSADYRRPLACGDSLAIALHPHRIHQGSFEVHYSFRKEQETVGRGLTRHVSILTASRKPCPLPAGIERWLAASNPEGIRVLWGTPASSDHPTDLPDMPVSRGKGSGPDEEPQA